MPVLGYLPKLKKGLGLAFGAHFLHDSARFQKCFLVNTLSMDKVSISYLFLLRISNKMCYQVLILTIDDVINFKIYLQSSSKAMTDRKKKTGGQKYKKLNTSETKRAF